MRYLFELTVYWSFDYFCGERNSDTIVYDTVKRLSVLLRDSLPSLIWFYSFYIALVALENSIPKASW